MTRTYLSISMIILAGFSIRAEAQSDSGPKPGTQVVAFKSHAITGENDGKLVDFVAERKAKPTVYLFVTAKDWDRPTARFLKAIDQEFVKGIDGVTEPLCVAVWLTNDQEKSKDYLPKAQQSLQFMKTALSVFDGNDQGPEGWLINTGVRLTAVVVREGKVISSFGYTSLNEMDAPAIVKALKL
jgi:hypothetical protein